VAVIIETKGFGRQRDVTLRYPQTAHGAAVDSEARAVEQMGPGRSVRWKLSD
jgi:hypothetical protein